MLDNLRERRRRSRVKRSARGSSDTRNTCYRLFSFFRFFLFFFTRPYLSYRSRRSALHLCRRRKPRHGDAAEQEQEVGDTPQRGAAALCWEGKKAVAVGSRGACGSCVAVVVFFGFFCGLLMINWQKEAETQQRPRSQVLNCRAATSCARLGKVSRDLEPQSSLLFHVKKKKL